MNVHETGQALFLTPPPKEPEIQVKQILWKKKKKVFGFYKFKTFVLALA